MSDRAGVSTTVERVAAPLRLQVIERIRDSLGLPEYQPGDRLVERELCERYGVSRTVIREALRHLEAEGLITIVPNHGPIVARITRGEAMALYDVRSVLEAQAGRLFAERANDAEKEALYDAIAEIERAIAADRTDEVLDLKDRFYDALFDGARNPIITSFSRTLHARVRMLRAVSLSSPGRPRETLAELQAVGDAVRDGDPQRAWDCCERHVKSAAMTALRDLPEDEDEAADGSEPDPDINRKGSH